MLIFIQQFFSLIRAPKTLDFFQDHCPPNSNGCIRVNKFNQYRANNIEMRLPVTFKQTDLGVLIREWADQQFYKDIPINITTNNETVIEHAKRNEFLANETYYYLSHTTWYGLVIDTIITVHDCVQVFKAQTVTMQS